MPKEAIEYVLSLPEYDAVMFERITGIKEESQVKEMTVAEISKALGFEVKVI